MVGGEGGMGALWVAEDEGGCGWWGCEGWRCMCAREGRVEGLVKKVL